MYIDLCLHDLLQRSNVNTSKLIDVACCIEETWKPCLSFTKCFVFCRVMLQWTCNLYTNTCGFVLMRMSACTALCVLKTASFSWLILMVAPHRVLYPSQMVWRRHAWREGVAFVIFFFFFLAQLKLWGSLYWLDFCTWLFHHQTGCHILTSGDGLDWRHSWM